MNQLIEYIARILGSIAPILIALIVINMLLVQSFLVRRFKKTDEEFKRFTKFEEFNGNKRYQDSYIYLYRQLIEQKKPDSISRRVDDHSLFNKLVRLFIKTSIYFGNVNRPSNRRV